MHYIKELVHDKTITLHYCPTEDHIAKIFTKSFIENRFSFLKSLLGVMARLLVSIPAYFEGGFSHEVFPYYLSLLSDILYLRLYMGDLWPCFQGPQMSKLGFRGVLGFIILPCLNHLLDCITLT